MKRDVNSDCLRVISMIFVIALHADKNFIKSPFLQVILQTILFTCNGMFYMLSGRYNLQKKFYDKEDYKNYYIGKIISILVPYVIVTFLLSLWDIIDSGTWNGIELYLKRTYVSFMHTNASIHLWFMYPLIGMLLGSPFISKMLNKMSNWELKLLLGIGIIWNIVSIYLTKDFNIHFSYSCWMLSGWTVYYFLGYYCLKVVNEFNKKRIYVGGGRIHCYSVRELLYSRYISKCNGLIGDVYSVYDGGLCIF